MIIIDQEGTYTQASIALRNDMLRIPLGMDIADEDLSPEANQIHFMAIKDEQVVGTVLLIPQYESNTGKLRQMCTSPEVRGEGFGIQLVNALEKYCLQNNMSTVVLHSRHYAVGFYEKLGYRIISEPFQEVGMEHFKMAKKLTQ
jgi:predicted GNAT family N-acyltransferase